MRGFIEGVEWSGGDSVGAASASKVLNGAAGEAWYNSCRKAFNFEVAGFRKRNLPASPLLVASDSAKSKRLIKRIPEHSDPTARVL
jgi:hypothetical protein